MAGPMKMKENKEVEGRYNISPEFRKFLEGHMEKGKTVDRFIGALNERTKRHAADMLKLNEQFSKTKSIETSSQLLEKYKTLTKGFSDDVERIVTEHTRSSFKDAAISFGTVTLVTAGVGAGIGMAAPLVMGGWTLAELGVMAAAGSAVTGSMGAAFGAISLKIMSPAEKKVLEMVSKEGITARI
ncbi:Uncharacterised protein [uncultured archaeon]|nr:Uncharacterised protein [uncultured archaeon]